MSGTTWAVMKHAPDVGSIPRFHKLQHNAQQICYDNEAIYTVSGTTWADEIKDPTKHAPDAGSIELQSSALPQWYNCLPLAG